MTAKKRPHLGDAKRLVVKIGSALLVEEETGELRSTWLDSLADDVAALRVRGQEVLIVSSGAIALGRRRLGLTGKKRRLALEEQQAAAAAGQIRLAHAYQESLGRHGLVVSQILLTLRDTEEWRRHLNARNTLGALLRLGAVPVINENDTVATAEIRYGDNDRLAARVAQMAGADCLVLLSDVDGLYTADPNKDPGAEFIERVLNVTPQIEAMAGRSASAVGSGGMTTKILAAKIAVSAGCHMCIAAGSHRHPVRRIEEGAPAGFRVPAIHCLRAATGVAAGMNQVQRAPSSMRLTGWRCEPAAMHMWQPAETAIFAARILVVMPPDPTSEADRPAMASICGVTLSTRSMNSAAGSLLGSAV